MILNFHSKFFSSIVPNFFYEWDSKRNKDNPQTFDQTPLHSQKIAVLCPHAVTDYDDGQNATVNGERYMNMIRNFTKFN